MGIKRLIDILLSLSGLVILSWLLLILAIIIPLDSPGCAVFTQERFGKNEKRFRIFKFRTMRQDAPKDVPTADMADPDQYTTRVGRFLRKTSLDELPQLFNILKGDMSIVGPRPALPNQTELNEARRNSGVSKIRPGLTGWAQINGRDEISDADKAQLDEYYMQHMSFLMDLKCFFGTIRPVLKGKNIR